MRLNVHLVGQRNECRLRAQARQEGPDDDEPEVAAVAQRCEVGSQPRKAQAGAQLLAVIAGLTGRAAVHDPRIFRASVRAGAFTTGHGGPVSQLSEFLLMPLVNRRRVGYASRPDKFTAMPAIVNSHLISRRPNRDVVAVQEPRSRQTAAGRLLAPRWEACALRALAQLRLQRGRPEGRPFCFLFPRCERRIHASFRGRVVTRVIAPRTRTELTTRSTGGLSDATHARQPRRLRRLRRGRVLVLWRPASAGAVIRPRPASSADHARSRAARSSCSSGSVTTIRARADPVDAFKKCCRNSGRF